MTAPRCPPDEAERRLEAVIDMMSRGQWLGRMSAKKLAAEWGVAVRTVQDYSRMASKIVWADGDEERAEVKADTMAKLGIIAAKAEQRGQFNAAVRALDSRAVVAGVVKQRGAGEVNVQVANIIASPDWHALRSLLLDALAPHPAALADVAAALERYSAEGTSAEPRRG